MGLFLHKETLGCHSPQHFIFTCAKVANSTQIRAWAHQVWPARYCVWNTACEKGRNRVGSSPRDGPGSKTVGRTGWLCTGGPLSFIHPLLRTLRLLLASHVPPSPRRAWLLRSHARRSVHTAMEEASSTAIDSDLRQLHFG